MTITTILLDLDNTLLGNSMTTFLPRYFAGLEQHFSQAVETPQVRHVMMKAVRSAQTQDTPETNLYDHFLEDFSRRIGISTSTTQNILNAFYRDIYPDLQQYTTFYPEAQEIVQLLLNQGYKVVIATNPLFPATAIEQRLAWAGVQHFSYALVTTMENSAFSKPDPNYYQEILDKVESRPGESWMVGNDPENDIRPAHALGLKTWWIADDTKDTTAPFDKKGSLANFLAWIKQNRPLTFD